MQKRDGLFGGQFFVAHRQFRLHHDIGIFLWGLNTSKYASLLRYETANSQCITDLSAVHDKKYVSSV